MIIKYDKKLEDEKRLRSDLFSIKAAIILNSILILVILFGVLR